jgi:hypothetical protein
MSREPAKSLSGGLFGVRQTWVVGPRRVDFRAAGLARVLGADAGDGAALAARTSPAEGTMNAAVAQTPLAVKLRGLYAGCLPLSALVAT